MYGEIKLSFLNRSRVYAIKGEVISYEKGLRQLISKYRKKTHTKKSEANTE